VIPLASVMKEKIAFYSLTLSDLESVLEGLGHKKFRARQLFQWVYLHKETNPENMLNLSKLFREEIPSLFHFELPEIILHKKSKDGTQKFLFRVGEKLSVETVLIPSGERNTLCVSSEVGCNMACNFCYTGTQKLKRRLTADEIVGQFLRVSHLLPENVKISNIVYMGMGEPLDNTDAVLKSIDILHAPLGINLSLKKITVSTSGIVSKIPLLTQSGVRLAVSLNASEDETRNKIMPINLKWNIKTLLEACRQHAIGTKDKVTLEYVLLKGINDSLEDARRVYEITKNVPSKINIIPFNEHPGAPYKKPLEKVVDAFQNELIYLGAQTLRRRTMGDDILAACGQLNSEATL